MRLVSSTRARVALLVAGLAAAAAAAIAGTAEAIGQALSHELGATLTFLVASVALQLAGIRLPGRGSLGASAVALIGAALVLGAGPAMAIAGLTALAQYLRTRGLAHRALFDAANLALAAGAAALVFEHAAALDSSGAAALLAALLAGFAYVAVNIGLLCVAMGLAEARSPLAVWQERFHWARFHVLGFGALAVLCASAYGQLGTASLVAFVLPPVLLALSMRERLARLSA